MEKFIVTQEEHETFNVYGESLGMLEKLALCYSPSIGKRRIYRSGFEKPGKGLKLLTFSTFEKAKEQADHTNDIYGSNFKVETIEE